MSFGPFDGWNRPYEFGEDDMKEFPTREAIAEDMRRVEAERRTKRERKDFNVLRQEIDADPARRQHVDDLKHEMVQRQNELEAIRGMNEAELRLKIDELVLAWRDRTQYDITSHSSD